MKVIQIIANAQNARLFENMGKSFGLDEAVTAQIVRYFVPPVTKTLEKRSQTPEGLISILEFLGSRRYDRFLDEPRIFGHEQVASEGRRILGYLFGTKERVLKIIENRAKVLPVDPVTLEKLFPYVAVLAIAAVEVRTHRPLGVILYRVMKGTVDERSVANPFLALAQYLKRQDQQQKDTRKRRLFSFFGNGSEDHAQKTEPTMGAFQSA